MSVRIIVHRNLMDQTLVFSVLVDEADLVRSADPNRVALLVQEFARKLEAEVEVQPNMVRLQDEARGIDQMVAITRIVS